MLCASEEEEFFSLAQSASEKRGREKYIPRAKRAEYRKAGAEFFLLARRRQKKERKKEERRKQARRISPLALRASGEEIKKSGTLIHRKRSPFPHLHYVQVGEGGENYIPRAKRAEDGKLGRCFATLNMTYSARGARGI